MTSVPFSMTLAARTTSKALLVGAAFRATSKATLFASANKEAIRRTVKSFVVGASVCAVGGAGAVIYALENSVKAGEFTAHAFPLPWSHSGLFSSLDYQSVRRGYEVYKQVCQACHSMQYVYFRHFVNVFMTEEEAKAEAANALIKDIDDTGKPIERPGALTDKLPAPYPNAKAAGAANNGAVPPDLSLMSLARHGGDDYIFSLLTSYFDPPAGVKVDEGKAYNPYFPGGVISMPQQLYDEGIEYSDGTPATQSQQAKDVATFMRWTAEPFHDNRKRFALKVLAVMPLLAFVLVYWKRHTWTFLKSQKFAWKTVKGREPPKH